jgi:hypothetical protein
VAPDLAGPVFGWRVWRVSRVGAGVRLRSVLRDDVWEPGEELAATCEHEHEPPDGACSCGIHAARDRSVAERYLTGRNEPADTARVIGLVALWGWVLVADGGWRASLAYPAHLILPARMRDAAEILRALSAYRVPVELR